MSAETHSPVWRCAPLRSLGDPQSLEVVRLIVPKLACLSSTHCSLLGKDFGNFRKLPLARVIQARGFNTLWWYNSSNVSLFSYCSALRLRSPVVFLPWHTIVDGQNDTRPSYMYYGFPTTLSPWLLNYNLCSFSSDSLACVSSYPPLSLHASTVVPVMCTAPAVPSLDASRTLTMVEALKSGQGSSLSAAAPSVLGPLASDTTLPSPSIPTLHPKTRFAVRVVLTCGASIFLKWPWLFSRPLGTSLASTTAQTRALPSLCPVPLGGHFSARWLPYWVTPSQMASILPASTLREWSPVPYSIILRLRTSWRACHSNVFARSLESPHHWTHTSCLLMFLLLLHL